MAKISDYLNQYGDLSFSDFAFGDVDNILLSEIVYMPFETVVSSDFEEEPVDFSDACEALFIARGCKHRPLGLMITKYPSVHMMAMANSRRFSEMKIAACTESFARKPAVQFGAATFILPDGTAVVVFRGTDDTLAGWQEDVDMFATRHIPSYDLSVQYLEKAAATFSGKLIVCGHSKGGHLALYAALTCSQQVRDRIIRVCNNDGPGFPDYRLFHTGAYEEILPRYTHIVPYASLVGMVMCHDDDYKVINSTRHLGVLQHSMDTWLTNGLEPDFKPCLSALGQITDYGLMNFLENVSEEQGKAVGELLSALLLGCGQITITDFAKSAFSSVGGMIKAWGEIPYDTKEQVKSAFSGVGKVLWNAVQTVKTTAAPAIAKRAEQFKKVVTQ